jgi:hypothetical protein
MIFTSTLGSPQHKNRDTVSNTPYIGVSATEYTPLRSKPSATKRWDNMGVGAAPGGGSMSSSSMGFSSF